MMKITFWGVFDSTHPRNRIFIEGIRDEDKAEITVLHRSVMERSDLAKGKHITIFGLLCLLIRLKFAYFGLIKDFFKHRNNTDIWVCGHIGQLDVIVLSWLNKLSKKKKPILFNPLVTIQDTLITENNKYDDSSFVVKVLRKIDQMALSRADHIIMDTKSHKIFISEIYNIPAEKISVIWIGAETAFFRPTVKLPKTTGRPFIVQFVGKFIPLHGIDIILDAAKWFNKDEVIFEIIGSGKMDSWFAGAIKERNLENIRLIPWVEYENLPETMRQSHISLGIFNTDAKSQRVIPNKVFQALALGRVTITAQSDGIGELQAKGIPIIAVKPNSGDDLARLINMVKDGYHDMHGFALQVKKLSRENFAPSILVDKFTHLCGLIIEGKEIPVEKTFKPHVDLHVEAKNTEQIWEELEKRQAEEMAARKEKEQQLSESAASSAELIPPPADEPQYSSELEIQKDETQEPFAKDPSEIEMSKQKVIEKAIDKKKPKPKTKAATKKVAAKKKTPARTKKTASKADKEKKAPARKSTKKPAAQKEALKKKKAAKTAVKSPAKKVPKKTVRPPKKKE